MFHSILEDANMADITIWRLPEVMSRTGLSRSTIYHWMSIGQFPERISIGSRAVGWDRRAVIEWLEARIVESRARNSEEGEK
ncbi:helix-turn-helix transcriptional regulator [Lentisalinibacter salinarum]|uniref:helix-turn-helix transcriptional regulator n=1 Tax=Lentisalinibacter salinarum TaxID=2992239 RepID=UPI0038692DCC